MNCAIAVDIGGTGIKYGLVDEDGTIIYKGKCDSEAQKGAAHVMEKVKSAIRELLAKPSGCNILGIGIGSAGQIDNVSGKVLFATPNIPGYTGTDIKGMIESEFALRTYVENDVNAATIGEMWKGAGTGAKRILGITIGTGIGGCIVFDGKVEHGTAGSAGEIGHMIIKFDGEHCNCGNRGCFEQYGSATALVRNFTKKLNKERASVKTCLIGEHREIDAHLIFNAARAGDKLANSVLEEFIENLAIGLSSLIHILNPELIIIGGGISNEGEFLLNKIYNCIGKYTMPSFLQNLRIVSAVLGNDAGIVGAAKLVFDNRQAP